MFTFKHLSWKLVFVFSLIIICGTSAIGIYSVYNLQTKVIAAAQEKLRSDLTIAKAYFNSRVPGEWVVKESKLFKGSTLINDSAFVDEIKEMTNDNVTIFLNDTRIATSVLTPEGTRAVGTKASSEVANMVLQSNRTFLGKAQVVGVDNQAIYDPILDVNGKAIGMFFVGVPNTPYERMITDFKISLAIFLVIEVLLSAVIILYMARRITKPIEDLANVAALVATGNLAVSIDIDAKDETGALAAAFSKMTDNLNQVIFHMGMAANQVAAGSTQVSDASLALSQGTTEQADAIEQLAASLKQISSQTNVNADHANEGRNLADAVKEKAANSKYHMNEMLQAMEEINASSANISKIIKVIDEIAFQTNILALNAAVEASRAGQHGKGFAVVAEEVRNLASRSANAAKETTALIEGSVRKVGDGTKVAKSTAEELNQIVEEVSKVAQLVDNIAVACSEQAIGISQVNQGIMQVSYVVQNNSSTAQQSAAASEELSSQAALLRDLVSRFNLKNGICD